MLLPTDCEVLTLTDPRMCEARIDTAVLRHNASALLAEAGAMPLLADVSADGHGHGALETSFAAIEGGAQWLGVSDAADAIALREAGIDAPILVSFAVGGSTHLPNVYLRSDSSVPALFDAGVRLYGIGPDAARLGLEAAMRVTAVVLTTKTIHAGEGVSYGYTYRAERDTNLAMIAIGYADGLDRRAGNAATVLLGGQDRRIVGRVAMNAAVLELGEDTTAVGEEAVLLGASGEPSADAWAQALGITADEAVTVFGRRLARSHR